MAQDGTGGGDEALHDGGQNGLPFWIGPMSANCWSELPPSLEATADRCSRPVLRRPGEGGCRGEVSPASRLLHRPPDGVLVQGRGSLNSHNLAAAGRRPARRLAHDAGAGASHRFFDLFARGHRGVTRGCRSQRPVSGAIVDRLLRVVELKEAELEA